MNNANKKIVVTGGAGFVGSNIIDELSRAGYKNITAVDTFSKSDPRMEYVANLPIKSTVSTDEYIQAVTRGKEEVPQVIIHFGARVDTSDRDKKALEYYNTGYTKALFDYSARHGVQFMYASSAATYGDGSKGYDDDERDLKPLNLYGVSKYKADEYILDAPQKPPQWIGLKLVNVYGPRESYKGRMATMVWHGYRQIMETGEIKLFKSYRPDFKDGEQIRDHVYVKDVARVVRFFLEHPLKSGIFNVGTGKGRTFLDLAHALFRVLDKEPRITFIPMPEDIRNTYQYFTEADITKLRSAGYAEPFYSLEKGIEDYIGNFHI